MGSGESEARLLTNSLRDVERAKASIPESYVWPKHLAPSVGHDEFGQHEIPVIDLGGFDSFEGIEYQKIVSQVADACANWGFFQAVNHGVSVELLERVQAMSEKFFDRSLETKEKLNVHLAGDRVLGYGFYKANHKTIMRLWSEGAFLDTSCIAEYSRILWPDDEDTQHEFCATLEEYFAAADVLAMKIVHLILNSLGIYPDNYDTYAPKQPGLLRFNHYPPCPDPSQAMGLMSHSDANLLTILHQGDVGGLQVLKDDTWVAVRPHPGAFAINVADMFQAISNGRYKSAQHRAVVNKTKHRYSIAYFVQPPDWDHIAPLPELVDSEHPLQYRPFAFLEFLKAQLLAKTNTLSLFPAQPNVS